MKANKILWIIGVVFLFILVPQVSGLVFSQVMYDDFERSATVNATQWNNVGASTITDKCTEGIRCLFLETGESVTTLRLNVTIKKTGKYLLEFSLRGNQTSFSDALQQTFTNRTGLACFNLNAGYPTNDNYGTYINAVWNNTAISSISGVGNIKQAWNRIRVVIDNDNGRLIVRFGNSTVNHVNRTYSTACGGGVRKVEFSSTIGDQMQLDKVRIWNFSAFGWNGTSSAPPPLVPSINRTYTIITFENKSNQYRIKFINYNITAASKSYLVYNTTFYLMTINYTNVSSVGFYKVINTPISYANKTNISLYFTYNLTRTGGGFNISTTSITSQKLYWNLTKYPRVNISAKDLITNSLITTYNINDSLHRYNTSNKYVYFRNNIAANKNVSFIDATHEYKTNNVTFIAGKLRKYQFLIYTTNSFNFTFLDEISNQTLHKNVSINLIGDYNSYNYTAPNGRLYADLIAPSDYVIRYSASEYGQIRQYKFSLVNGSHNMLNLYLINQSSGSPIVVTVYNQITTNPITGAIVYLQRYFLKENDYRTVAIYQTDAGGNANFDVQLYNESYIFIVDYPWKTPRLVTNGQYITSNSVNLYVSLVEQVGKVFYNINKLSYSLTFTNTTNLFSLSWNDPYLVGTSYCLYIKKYGQFGSEIINSSCSASHSGSISLGGLVENKTYYAVFTSDIVGGSEHIVASIWKEITGDTLNTGQVGLFFTIILVMMFVFISSLHIYSLITGTVILIFTKLIGITEISWFTIFMIILGAIFLAVLIEMKRR